VVVVGAGPAGLTAAVRLRQADVDVTVVEATDSVGGISRTVERDGWRFDLGGHRFFTKVPEVEAFWHEVLPDEDFLMRPRMSRILYRGKLFDYPLKPFNALFGLGVLEAIRCVLSYALVRVRPPKDQSNFEGWVAARFGWRLYRIFFKTYTEKVWGVPATDIQADWAAQRIKNLSLLNAVTSAFGLGRSSGQITTLIEEFQYPRLGPGMMWDRARDLVLADGGELRMQAKVASVRHAGGAAHTVVLADGTALPASSVISTMPLPSLVRAMDPPAPAEVLEAADGLSFRDFLTVALVVPATAGFPDNWIYIHEPGVRVGRVQNFGSWSPQLVKDGYTCLGLEFFVSRGDDLWEHRRGAHRPGQARARDARTGADRPGAGGLRRTGPQGLPGVRRGLRRARRGAARLARPHGRERAPRRTQRHAPLQQPGPLDAHRDAHRGQHRHGRPARRVDGQRGGGLPRDRQPDRLVGGLPGGAPGAPHRS